MAKRYVLVSNPESFCLSDSFIDQFSLLGKGWLHEGRACEIITKEPINIPSNLPVDVFEIDPLDDNRKKQFLFCDMDSTILQDETLDKLAEHLPKDIHEKIVAITEQAMAGELDFTQALTRRVSYLKGLDATLFKTLIPNLPFSKGAQTLVKTMKRHGAFCVLISGGFTHVTAPIAGSLSFDEHHGNNLVTRDNKFTGELSGKILDGQEKSYIVKRVLNRYKATKENAISVGDGANDVNMLEQTAFNFAFHGKDILKEKARFQINHTDLTSILYAQGFKQDEIVWAD